jgi:hypothetical protein
MLFYLPCYDILFYINVMLMIYSRKLDNNQMASEYNQFYICQTHSKPSSQANKSAHPVPGITVLSVSVSSLCVSSLSVSRLYLLSIASLSPCLWLSPTRILVATRLQLSFTAI